MRKFGLIGHPIVHSLSPKLFIAAYDGKYEYDLIEGEDFEKVYSKFLSEYDGINITAPFKELAFNKASHHTDSCKKIGATNILIKKDDIILAHNSDYAGVILSLKPYSLKKGSRTLVVGCGGAGKAAVVAAVTLEFNVSLYNRTISRAKDWLTKAGLEEKINLLSEKELAETFLNYDLIIYTLPCGFEGLDTILSEAHNNKIIILEANYKDPVFSGERLNTLITKGATYIHGKNWLLNQALAGYEIFTGEKVNFAKMKEIL